MPGRPQLPEDLQQLLTIVREGKLFLLQEWIAAGKPFRFPAVNDCRARVLRAAVETGFHSVVAVLLAAGGWVGEELAEAIEIAFEMRRRDLADLILSSGAKLEQVSFYTICKTMDLELMERFLRAGGNPSHENNFAYALSHLKARPLLRFYRSFHSEFPALEDQAALALYRAVDKEEVRWTALLAWAGADPFRAVPYNDEDSFPVSPDDSTTAASTAIWRNNPEILKVLKLKPPPAKAVELLKDAAYKANVELFRTILKDVMSGQLNDRAIGSCTALERLVGRGCYRDYWSNTRSDKGDAESLECVGLLLDAGAKWNPPAEELRYARRSVLEHGSRYIVQLLRLLLCAQN